MKNKKLCQIHLLVYSSNYFLAKIGKLNTTRFRIKLFKFLIPLYRNLSTLPILFVSMPQFMKKKKILLFYLKTITFRPYSIQSEDLKVPINLQKKKTNNLKHSLKVFKPICKASILTKLRSHLSNANQKRGLNKISKTFLLKKSKPI